MKAQIHSLLCRYLILTQVSHVLCAKSKGIETAKDGNQGTQLLRLRALQSTLVPIIDCSAYSSEMGLIALAGAGKVPTVVVTLHSTSRVQDVVTYNG